ncbi:hypothetical protein EV652_109109 [Kribbella steppae]|uniref:Cobalt/nickel transport protein n=1 Tax=Kribbella steppae TaxID=2512223 RepID=A0A4R2HAI4_9ACTN|nr:hypothetical protein [Kribbella steppae]TCO23284.1 hypothetical protein EV652_109109 [Kribbella steppae]
MKHIRTLVAVPVLTCGIALAGMTQASAYETYPEDDYRTVVEPAQRIYVDDTVAEVLQATAGAIGGAGIALSTLWVYRRRHPIHAQ